MPEAPSRIDAPASPEAPAQVLPERPVDPVRPKASPARWLAPLAWLIGASLLLAGAGYYAWSTWGGAAGEGAGLLTASATRGNLEDTVTATGTLQPKELVDVGTQVSGQVKQLLVEVGAVVKAGQLLAQIDPSVYQAKVDGDRAQLLNQRAQLADRQAQLVLAQLQFQRQRNLDREEATTAEAVQGAEAAQQSAQAQVQAIQAQMQQTESTLRGDEASLGYTRIYAPISGTVVSQAVKQGQTLNANQQAPIVMRIANLSTMTVQAQVSEADVSKLRVGMDVYFTTLGGSNRRFYGTLRQIPPTPNVVNNVVLYDALFDVPNPDQALMTQMTAQVFFVVASAREAVLVPVAALRPLAGAGRGRMARSAGAASAAQGAEGPRGGRGSRNAADSAGAQEGGGERISGIDPRERFAGASARVDVLGDDGKVLPREVKVGVMNRVSAQILEGLEPGEKVVLGNAVPATAQRVPAGNALTPNPAQRGGRP